MTSGTVGSWWQQTPSLEHDLFGSSLGVSTAAATSAPTFSFGQEGAVGVGAPAPSVPAFNSLFSDPLKQRTLFVSLSREGSAYSLYLCASIDGICMLPLRFRAFLDMYA